MSKSAPKVRCAIYTRKSGEEGLDQAFNSLHAQREACEAYIKSQAGEGWLSLKRAYDDGGLSGGTMDRPALTQLLADIEDGHIDVVVVYKVDRLTRSLADFARIIDVFDRKGVSFVSVTQAFNTTSSMGRLTLNVLLSFAQFEREVTGERIRDKIAASKAKGMWMGGRPPLGYDVPEDRTTRALKINEAEAVVIRTIFDRYLQMKSVNLLRASLAKDGIRSKAWTTRSGRSMGGYPFTNGALCHLLKSRTYIGEITHRGAAHPGAHQGIVARDVFDAVQEQLQANTSARRQRPILRASLPLQGVIFDGDGNRMVPSFAYGKGGKRHDYYVSRPLLSAEKLRPELIGRLAAKPIEALVIARLQRLFAQPELTWDQAKVVLQRVSIEPNAVRLRSVLTDEQSADFEIMRSRLDHGDRLEQAKRNGQEVELIIPMRPVFRGGRTWIVKPGGQAIGGGVPDVRLLKALALGHQQLDELNAGPTLSDERWRSAISAPNDYVRRRAMISFLAPDIQRRILAGEHPPGLTANQILERATPLAWADQRQAFGFSGSPSIP